MIMASMQSTTERASARTAYWHPFADMGEVAKCEFVLARGEGVWVWDDRGRRYLDATASLWCSNVGHGRAEIVRAVAGQMSRLEAYSCLNDLSNEPVRQLTAHLSALAPMDDARVFLTSGGGAAIDAAAKLTRRYWHACGRPERTHLISRTASFHGAHGFGTSLGGISDNRNGWGPLHAGVSVVPHDSLEALARELELVGPDNVAAFFMEPVIGVGGVHPPSEGYVEGVAKLCRDAGVLLVVDSGICGFGRLGTWFGIERWRVRPDMITFGTAVTSGYLPLGGVVVSGAVAAPFWDAPVRAVFRHGCSGSGHAACCAGALRNLTILEEEGLIERGRTLESSLKQVLDPLVEHPFVHQVRGGVGLLAAVELSPDVLEEDPDATRKLAERVRDHGVLVRPLLTSVAVCPPLTTTPAQFALIQEAIRAALDGIESTTSRPVLASVSAC